MRHVTDIQVIRVDPQRISIVYDPTEKRPEHPQGYEQCRKLIDSAHNKREIDRELHIRYIKELTRRRDQYIEFQRIIQHNFFE